MAQGLFVVGFTVSEVLAIQSKAKAMLLEGKTVMQWGDGGSSATKQFAMSVKETLSECAYALRILAPETYGARKTVSVSSVSPYFHK